MSDPEYRAKMEEKERLTLEREKKRQERATKKKKIALAELKEQAEKAIRKPSESLRSVELLQENVQGNQQKSVSREQKMTLNMRNIWKREMQNTTDGIPQEERSRWKP